jgi:large subunit ribosomal protein L15
VRIDDLRPPRDARRSRRRVARGNAGRAGTYAGRGRKGQKARSGGAKAPYFEGGQLPLVRRLPYRRGFTRLRRVEYSPINLGALEALFEPGAQVTAEELVRLGALRRADEPYKVLADGEVTKSLTVHAPRFSEMARRAIEQAGGACVLVADDYVRPGLGRRRARR